MKAALRVLVFAIAAMAPAAAYADYVTGLNPRGDNFLALRSGPGTSYRTIRRMDPDTVVTVLERRGDWLRVELGDGTRGWAFGEYIAPGYPPGYEDEDFEEQPFDEGDLGPPEEEEDEELVESDEQVGEDQGPAVEETLTAEDWTRYENDRFGTAVDYPADLFEMQPPAGNDDGRSFATASGSATFMLFASSNVFDRTLAELKDDDIAGGGYDSVTYQREGGDWYVLSGNREGGVFYRKVMLSADGGTIHTFEIAYPRARKTFFDPVAARMAKSMSIGEAVTVGETPVRPADEETERGGEVTPEPEAEQVVLFDGTLGDDWVAYSESGGSYDRDARLVDGALVVDVPAESGWGRAGILSPGGLVWLDDSGPSAESTVTFSFDPKRTTGFVVSLTVPGGNPWGAPHVTMAWSRVADGASSEARFFLSSTEPFKTIELPSASPVQVKVMLRPYEVAWSIDGGDEIVGAFPSARPGTGLHVAAYSNTLVWNAPVSMTLKSITLDQVRDPVAEEMMAVDEGVLFDGTESSDWEPISVEGGDLAKWGRYRGGYLVVDVPEGNWWGQVGIVSAAPVLAMSQFSDAAPYRIKVHLDPERTDGFGLGLGPDKVQDWWGAHWAWIGISRDADGRHVLSAMDSPYYTNWQRPIPESWTGDLVVTLSAEGTLASIPEGPGIFVPRPLYEGTGVYLGLHSRPREAGQPSSFAVGSVTWERVVPADLTPDELWFFQPPEKFDVEAFMADVQAGVLADTFSAVPEEEAAP